MECSYTHGHKVRDIHGSRWNGRNMDTIDYLAWIPVVDRADIPFNNTKSDRYVGTYNIMLIKLLQTKT